MVPLFIGNKKVNYILSGELVRRRKPRRPSEMEPGGGMGWLTTWGLVGETGEENGDWTVTRRSR